MVSKALRRAWLRWARQKAVSECIQQFSELGEDTEGLLNTTPTASPER